MSQVLISTTSWVASLARPTPPRSRSFFPRRLDLLSARNPSERDLSGKSTASFSANFPSRPELSVFSFLLQQLSVSLFFWCLIRNEIIWLNYKRHSEPRILLRPHFGDRRWPPLSVRQHRGPGHVLGQLHPLLHLLHHAGLLQVPQTKEPVEHVGHGSIHHGHVRLGE